MELKSIRTDEEAQGNGVGRAVVDRLIATARERGASRVSLEAGPKDALSPSRALYGRLGF